jgi:hypothetical protein
MCQVPIPITPEVISDTNDQCAIVRGVPAYNDAFLRKAASPPGAADSSENLSNIMFKRFQN